MISAHLRTFCEFQLFALAFALPFEYYLAGREQTLLTSLKLQILLLLASWVSLKLAEWHACRSASFGALKELFPGRLALPLACFALIGLISAVSAPEFRENALRAGAKTVVGALLTLVAADLCRASHSGRSPARGFLVALALGGTCTALLGLADFAGVQLFSDVVHLFQPNTYWLGDRVRMVSTMEYPNTAGSLLLVAICATLALAVFPQRQHGRRWWSCAALIMLLPQGAALTLTYSRGALGATIVAVVAATWVVRSLPWTRQRQVVVLGCLAILLGGFAYLARVRYEPASEMRSLSTRVALFGLEARKDVETLAAGRSYDRKLAVHNNSKNEWRRGEFGIGYRWYHVGAKVNSPLYVGADFTEDIGPARKAEVPVVLETPAAPGEYLLIWFVFRKGRKIEEIRESYAPAILCLVNASGSSAVAPAASETARSYLGAIDEERRSLSHKVVPGRWELWSAALRMFRHRPVLGIGPDNFRLLKWKHMEVPKGDESILSNSIYLEFLSGTGVLGLGSFLWLMWASGRSALAKTRQSLSSSGLLAGYFGAAYIAGLMSHGFVDYFLKFTPTFLVFWLVLGLLWARTAAAEENCGANRI